MFEGQHTIEALALVSDFRDTLVWGMIYDHLCYEHGANIFAEQQKHPCAIASFDTFNSHLESEGEKHMLIRDLVYSYNLELSTLKKRHGTICAIAALENIFDRYGYHVWTRFCACWSWKGEISTLFVNTLNAVVCLIAAY